ncbi:2-oxoadipate dioxygenase/decarboxylase HglS [Larsenimonas salina]|uniref:2-oxoadipate dioxygenase/decarboxylase HglS n=1 Tax=Larsenimonas salina TaxID=1295565 RepID=UPI00255C29B0|nr:VOC family protein [Larsenimonas salina]
MATFLDPSVIRTRFSSAMSAMYQTEVPQYATLLSLVDTVNRSVLENDPALHARLENGDELARLGLERHGAIRLGTAEELHTMRRLFAVMGMFPVGYYDLSEAGVPVHSTAFRPVSEQELKKNPFRVFTSLLRLELIDNEALRAQASALLAKRQIFTDGAISLIERAEQHGGLTAEDADRFVAEALETFRWHPEATVDYATYQALHDEHRLIADVVCFKGPHINHLTPRTLDIDAVQRQMPEAGIAPKAIIEGPPRREVPILLRQTSFKALEEPIDFAGRHHGTHTARFGEIEQRGVALTPKGRALYDRLLTASRDATAGLSQDAHQQALSDAFTDFPDDEPTLRRQGLAYFTYRLSGTPDADSTIDTHDIDDLIERGLIEATPIVYEDFLPVSAAGIFQSNLGEAKAHGAMGSGNQAAFEAALGASVADEFALYENRERTSLEAVQSTLEKGAP